MNISRQMAVHLRRDSRVSVFRGLPQMTSVIFKTFPPYPFLDMSLMNRIESAHPPLLHIPLTLDIIYGRVLRSRHTRPITERSLHTP